MPRAALLCILLLAVPFAARSGEPAARPDVPVLVIDGGGMLEVRASAEGEALFESAVLLRRLDAPADDPSKGSYGLIPLDAAGKPAAAALLGMPPGARWLIRGSDTDRGMLRSALGGILAKKLFGAAAPELRFCELYRKTGDNLRYEGLYLLTEDPEMEEEDAERRAVAIFAALDSAEPSVYFSGYADLDIDSFIDCFILNEVMQNYPEDAPFRLRLSGGGTTAAVPDGDFSAAFDNTREAVSGRDASTDRYFRFGRLLRSSAFLDRLAARYYRLTRGNVIGGAALCALTDEIAAAPGAALDRDWERWRSVYEGGAEPALLPEETAEGTRIRQTRSPEQELLKIKRRLMTGDYAVRNRLSSIVWTPGLFTPAMNAGANALYAVLFVAVFFLIVVYARRRM